MKKTLTGLLLIAGILILGGFGCNKKKPDEPIAQQPAPQPAPVATPDIVPPPPEIIAEIEQKGYSEEERQYIEILQEAPNQDIDFFQAELGL